MNIVKLLGWLQLLTWVSIVSGIFYLIFVRDSPLWYGLIQIGVGIQFLLILITFLLKRKLNTWWFILNLILLCIFGFVELENRDIIHLNIFGGAGGFAGAYFFIIISIGVYLFSLRFIISDLRENNVKAADS